MAISGRPEVTLLLIVAKGLHSSLIVAIALPESSFECQILGSVDCAVYRTVVYSPRCIVYRTDLVYVPLTIL